MISARTLIGSSLVLVGFLTIYFATPIAIPLGAPATLLATWAAVILLAGGTFLILKLSLRVSAISLLAATALALPISIIYMTPLPGDSQILLGSLIALVAILLIRFYKRPNHPKNGNPRRNETSSSESLRRNLCERHSVQSLTLPRLLGCAIVAASGLLFYFIVPAALSFSLLVTSLVIVLIIAVGVVGYSLISPLSFKQFMQWLVSATIVAVLPFGFILSAELKILVGSLLTVAIILLFYWGYLKIIRSKREQP